MGDEVWTHLKVGGRVFVCGDGRRMAPAVREAFMTIYSVHTGAGDEARAWPASLTESGHYIEDVRVEYPLSARRLPSPLQYWTRHPTAYRF
ncbi:hypothetical protein ACWD1Y_32220 [Streptomyces sp. NPDC002814]